MQTNGLLIVEELYMWLLFYVFSFKIEWWTVGRVQLGCPLESPDMLQGGDFIVILILVRLCMINDPSNYSHKPTIANLDNLGYTY